MKYVTLGFCRRILGRLCPALKMAWTEAPSRHSAWVASRNRLASTTHDTRRRGTGYFVAPTSPPSRRR